MLDSFYYPLLMKLPRLLVYSLPFFGLLLLVWLLEPVIYYYWVPIKDKLTVEKSDIAEIKVIAHRGASGIAPENTLAAVDIAIEQKVDMIEIDVHLSADGQLMVIHDESLERTTDGEGMIHEYTAKELKKLDAGAWFGPEFSEEKIPTLDEVLTRIRGRATCLIELKWAEEFLYEEIVAKVHESIDRNNAEDWVVIESFEEDYLVQSNAIDPSIPVQKLIVFEESAPLFSFHLDNEFHLGDVDLESYYKGLNPYYLSLTQRRVVGLHVQGLTVYTYTVNEREDMEKLLLMGVDGIITDFPDRLIDLKNNWPD